MVESILLAYATTAVITAGYVYRAGVGTKPVSKLFGLAERFTLVLASAGVGALWPLFVPGLVVAGIRRVRPNVERHRSVWRVLSGRPRHAGG